MKSLVSIRIGDRLLQAMQTNAHLLHLSQTDYIRMAIEQMNSETERQARVKRLKSASLRVRKESMKINTEFGEVEHDPEVE